MSENAPEIDQTCLLYESNIKLNYSIEMWGYSILLTPDDKDKHYLHISIMGDPDGRNSQIQYLHILYIYNFYSGVDSEKFNNYTQHMDSSDTINRHYVYAGAEYTAESSTHTISDVILSGSYYLLWKSNGYGNIYSFIL